MELIQSTDSEIIRELKWEGNYAGDSIPEGKVSMTFAMNLEGLIEPCKVMRSKLFKMPSSKRRTKKVIS